jgi:hypothetical protein
METLSASSGAAAGSRRLGGDLHLYYYFVWSEALSVSILGSQAPSSVNGPDDAHEVEAVFDDLSCKPRTRQTMGTTSEALSTEARATNATPFGKRSAASRAAWTASRVSPAPPTPVSVSNWTAG